MVRQTEGGTASHQNWRRLETGEGAAQKETTKHSGGVWGGRRVRGSQPCNLTTNVHVLPHAQVRAIVSADKAVVFKSHSERENQNLIAPMLQVGLRMDSGEEAWEEEQTEFGEGRGWGPMG